MTLIDIYTVFWTFIAAFILFSITVLVHELGHFLAGRWLGLVVERFAIGFGPPVITRKYGGVEYCLNWLPFGGYVMLPQMAAMDALEGESSFKPHELPPVAPWKKIITAFAGPYFSFLLAVVLAILCFYIGVPQDQAILSTTIGFVEPGSPADLAGVKTGDRVLTIDGRTVTRWQGRYYGVVESILFSVGKTVHVEVERDGKKLSFDITPQPSPTKEGLRWLGFEDYCAAPLIVGDVKPDSPAFYAGLKAGDEILALNGEKMVSGYQAAYIFQHAKDPVMVEYARGDETHRVSIMPKKPIGLDKLLVGIEWKTDFTKIAHISALEQLTNSATSVFRIFRALFTPGSRMGIQHLSGPIGIFDLIMHLLTIDVRLVLFFTVMLNVNLAIMNLMPLPILDGGHITVSLCEIFLRRPVKTAILYPLYVGCFVFIMGLFAFVTFHDIWRIGERVSNETPEIRFSPRPDENPPKPEKPLPDH